MTKRGFNLNLIYGTKYQYSKRLGPDGVRYRGALPSHMDISIQVKNELFFGHSQDRVTRERWLVFIIRQNLEWPKRAEI